MADRATNRLLDYLPRYFDIDARTLLALRVSHPDGFAWRIAGRVLTASTEADAAIGVYELPAMSLTALADALESAGCSVLYADADAGHLQADVLIDGTGRESESNGDHLYAYTANIWAVVDAHAEQVEAAEDCIDAALADAHLDTAEGEFLDIWGGYFGVPRAVRTLSALYRWGASTWSDARTWGNYKSPLDDTAYAASIVAETLRPRGNPFAIEKAVLEGTGVSCRIYEPWQDVARFDESASDDRWHLYDANFWTWNVIQPIWYGYPSLIDVAAALEVIERNRPLGTPIVHPGETPGPVGLSLSGVVASGDAMAAGYALPVLLYGATDCSASVAAWMDIVVGYGATDARLAMAASMAMPAVNYGYTDTRGRMGIGFGVPIAAYSATDCSVAVSAWMDIVIGYAATDCDLSMAMTLAMPAIEYRSAGSSIGMAAGSSLSMELPGAAQPIMAASCDIAMVLDAPLARPVTWSQGGVWPDTANWGARDAFALNISES